MEHNVVPGGGARRKSLAAPLLALLIASPALAAEPLSSPPLLNIEGNLSDQGRLDTFTCMVVNTGARPTRPDVTIELVRGDGSIIVRVGPFALLPNDPRIIFWESAEQLAACQVSGSVQKRRTQITLCNGESAGGPCEAVVYGP